MTHGPPFDTCCDMLKSDIHCGSRAIRNCIEQFQPLLTLHGHIHETVDKMNGVFTSVIGATTCASCGNYPQTSHIALLEVDIANDQIVKLERIKYAG